MLRFSAEETDFQTLRPQRKQNVLFRTARVDGFVFVFVVYLFVLDLNGLFTQHSYRKLHCSEIAVFCLLCPVLPCINTRKDCVIVLLKAIIGVKGIPVCKLWKPLNLLLEALSSEQFQTKFISESPANCRVTSSA